MNQDKYVFTQITDFLNRSKFNRIVAKYNGDRYVKSYSCWNQLLTLIFNQIGRYSSLLNCIIALQAHYANLYNLEIGKNLSRSNLAKANDTLSVLLLLCEPRISQQLWPICLGGSRAVSQSLADRTLLQVAQTASEDKAFLRHITQCCQDTSLCCYHHFLSCGDSATWHETDINYVWGFADFECVSNQQNALTRFTWQN